MANRQTQRKPVQLHLETYQRLEALAAMNRRNLGAQVAWMVDKFYTELPHPADAQSVPVVYVNQKADGV
jgi:hypothetical protein